MNLECSSVLQHCFFWFEVFVFSESLYIVSSLFAADMPQRTWLHLLCKSSAAIASIGKHTHTNTCVCVCVCVNILRAGRARVGAQNWNQLKTANWLCRQPTYKVFKYGSFPAVVVVVVTVALVFSKHISSYFRRYNSINLPYDFIFMAIVRRQLFGGTFSICTFACFLYHCAVAQCVCVGGLLTCAAHFWFRLIEYVCYHSKRGGCITIVYNLVYPVKLQRCESWKGIISLRKIERGIS